MAVLGTAQTLPSQPIPGQDPIDCMSSLYAIPNCLQEIAQPFVNGEFGTIGHSCCHAFLGLSADCITESCMHGRVGYSSNVAFAAYTWTRPNRLYVIPVCYSELSPRNCPFVCKRRIRDYWSLLLSCLLGLSADCITESLEPLLIWYWSKPIKPSTLYCTSPPATADIVPPQLELNLGGRGDACYQIPMACPIYYLDLMGIGDGSRAVPLPMSLACSSPVMHVAAKMACGG
ncbi:hypothetical protein HID58_091471 [Brassica napus]|uniref:Prolamin-like domain-containing protein n=1 Tax=Brassica napus TaxID=3708 RepID=A0ABQ7X234_BRANA|nr:hypothetical protein HID58_091471 [Brassica napus]